MKPILDPTRDLVGATPEALARALFQRSETLRPGRGTESIVSDEVAVEQVPADHSGNGIAHLPDGV